jgi:hypothetical protein
MDLEELTKIDYLKDETFNSIAKRLVGFYTKGGKARTFDIGKDQHKGKIRLPAGAAPTQELRDAAEKQNESGEKRADREGLSKKVDQWTDAWEYKQLIGHVNNDPAFKKAKVPDLYRKAEDIAVHDFWSRCDELWDICQNPALPVEKEACARCAFDAVFTKCIDGRKQDEHGYCPERARPREYPGGWCDGVSASIKNKDYDRILISPGDVLKHSSQYGNDSGNRSTRV